MKQLIYIAFIFTLTGFTARAQESVRTLFKKEIDLADDYYKERKYRSAFELYDQLYKKNASLPALSLKMARCCYQLKEYHSATLLFKKCDGKDLTNEDQLWYAEALAADGRTKEAIVAYHECLKRNPQQPVIAQKVWRLANIQYLYEDSLHYAVRNISLNTKAGEFCPVPYNNGLLFISNREEQHVVEKKDGALNAPFYHLYFSKKESDLPKDKQVRYGEPAPFSKEMYSTYHAGPLSFYDKQRKMVFTSTGEHTGMNSKRTLQLFFASEENGKWKVTGSFPYNSLLYSLTDPSINEKGTVLYFSSKMKDSFGGKDIYRSIYRNGRWTRPENLGETINTPYDEVFPYLHQGKTLYFSSNGHPGMGGLDIFKSTLTEKGFDEVVNAGYPINSTKDEFGIVLDSTQSHGYFSSNRKRGGYDDDLYELDIDLQTYPLEIAGWLGLKEHNWSDSTDIKTFAGARFYLIDITRNAVVQEGSSDEQGNFTWIIPYFSKYRMRVVGPDQQEYAVGLDIPKQKQLHGKHEIVIVKDPFTLN